MSVITGQGVVGKTKALEFKHKGMYVLILFGPLVGSDVLTSTTDWTYHPYRGRWTCPHSPSLRFSHL